MTTLTRQGGAIVRVDRSRTVGGLIDYGRTLIGRGGAPAIQGRPTAFSLTRSDTQFVEAVYGVDFESLHAAEAERHAWYLEDSHPPMPFRYDLLSVAPAVDDFFSTHELNTPREPHKIYSKSMAAKRRRRSFSHDGVRLLSYFSICSIGASLVPSAGALGGVIAVAGGLGFNASVLFAMIRAFDKTPGAPVVDWTPYAIESWVPYYVLHREQAVSQLHDKADAALKSSDANARKIAADAFREAMAEELDALSPFGLIRAEINAVAAGMLYLDERVNKPRTAQKVWTQLAEGLATYGEVAQSGRLIPNAPMALARSQVMADLLRIKTARFGRTEMTNVWGSAAAAGVTHAGMLRTYEPIAHYLGYGTLAESPLHRYLTQLSNHAAGGAGGQVAVVSDGPGGDLSHPLPGNALGFPDSE